MTSILPIESLPGRVPIPVEMTATPLDDYTALLVRLHQAERALAEEQAQHQAAEDRLWAQMVDRLEQPRREAAAESGSPAVRLAALLKTIESLWSEAGLEVIDPRGQRLADVRELNLEVLCTRQTSNPSEEGLIAETWRPLVRRRGHTIQSGQVVVLTTSGQTATENN